MTAAVNCTRHLVCRPSSAAATTVVAAAAAAGGANAVLGRRPSFIAGSTISIASPAASLVRLPRAPSALFSTSTALAAPKKDAKQHMRTGKRLQVGNKKNRDTNRGRAPEPGERKAMRKSIVLSNGNALEVPGLEELEASSCLLDAADGRAPRVLALPLDLIDKLRAAEAFKATQSFPLFRRASLLVRRETTALATQMQAAAAADKTLRIVVDGDRFSGKSTLLTQAMAHAFLNDWIVINVPEAQELTTACTEYAPLSGSNPDAPTQYVQPVYMLRLLRAIEKANAGVLAKHHTVRAHDHLPLPMPAGSTLLQLVQAARDVEAAWPVYQVLWSELCTPAPEGALPRPPVLFALDGLAHIMRVSDYRAPDYTLIHSHDLTFVGHIADTLGGTGPQPAGGGAVIAATCRSNMAANRSLEHMLALRAHAQKVESAKGVEDGTTAAPLPPPPTKQNYRRYDDRVEACLQSVQVLQLPGVSRDEARALMEYWAASGVLRDRIDEVSISNTWALGGNGIVGEMERAALHSVRPKTVAGRLVN